MSETTTFLRRHPFTGQWVLFVPDRRHRPGGILTIPNERRQRRCAFCPGMERTTPPEILRLTLPATDLPWWVRVFPNRYPVLTTTPSHPLWGIHEIVVETPYHRQRPDGYSSDQWTLYLQALDRRLEDLTTRSGVRWVQVFKNEGWAAGASIEHAHTQIVAMSRLPPYVRQMTRATRAYTRVRGRCFWCDAIERVLQDRRRLVQPPGAWVVYVPEVPRWPFEVWLVPQPHVTTWAALSPTHRVDLMDRLSQLLRSLVSRFRNPCYNWFVYAGFGPWAAWFHLHWVLVPRLVEWAGFEWSTGIIVNPWTPEAAAAVLRASGEGGADGGPSGASADLADPTSHRGPTV